MEAMLVTAYFEAKEHDLCTRGKEGRQLRQLKYQKFFALLVIVVGSRPSPSCVSWALHYMGEIKHMYRNLARPEKDPQWEAIKIAIDTLQQCSAPYVATRDLQA
jgi:dihydrodipicolinate synthase/N-acetylneuraminate lyase